MYASSHVNPRPVGTGRRGLRPATAVVTAALTALSTFTFAVPAGSDVLSGVEASTLGRTPQMTPDDLGADALDGLQYPDPATGLDLVAPPEVDQQGGAGVAHALSVPRGRAGVEPDLALTYDSSGGNGWVGLGWDLSLGSVEVDTRWGVPLMCPAGGALCGPDGERDVESETYLLDGDVLAPTSIRPSFEPRVADRADWVRRAETEWERVVRHGSSPTDYWWEVTDKLGTHRFYGATPDGTRDPDSIVELRRRRRPLGPERRGRHLRQHDGRRTTTPRPVPGSGWAPASAAASTSARSPTRAPSTPRTARRTP